MNNSNHISNQVTDIDLLKQRVLSLLVTIGTQRHSSCLFQEYERVLRMLDEQQAD